MATRESARMQPKAGQQASQPAKTRTIPRRPTGKRGAVADKQAARFVGMRIFARAKVSPKGWIVIPKAIRDEMGLRPGDEVSLMLSPPLPGMKQDRGLYKLHVTRVPEDPVSLFAGAFADVPGGSWTEALLEERRRERDREERIVPRRKSESA